MTTRPPATPPATATEAAAPRIIRSVRQYGACGDGITDDTEALRRALTTVTGFITVFFPPGTYLITDTLLWDPYRVELRGQDAVIRCNMATPGTYSVHVTPSASAAADSPRNGLVSPYMLWARNRSLEFVSANGTSAGFLFSGTPGVLAAHGSAWAEEPTTNSNLMLANMVFRGFTVAHHIQGHSPTVRFRDCILADNNAAVLIDSPDSLYPGLVGRGTHAAYASCEFLGNNSPDWMFDLTGNQELVLNNCSLSGSAALIRAADTSSVQVLASRVENTGDHYREAGWPTTDAPEHQASVVLTDAASIQFKHTTLRLNVSPVATLPHIFYVGLSAQCTLRLCSVAAPRVTALTTGGGRFTAAQTRTAPVENIHGLEPSAAPLRGLNARHNRLGAVNGTEGWSTSQGTLGYRAAGESSSADITAERDIVSAVYTSDEPTELSVLVPLSGTQRHFEYRIEACAGEGTSGLTVHGERVQFFFDGRTDVARTIITSVTPVELVSTRWDILTASINLDTLDLNPDLYGSARVVLSIGGARTGSVLHVSRPYAGAHS
ncbi:hypothetical protein GCM10022198_01910 [Klugiella xanthotipulae]|uniref:Pectate lyase-like protein n=1 Tax=Klugiella xanthotipulae TaxID=244735 RepID=A0A543I4Z2_9MICO|nr:glycosyl hydrolase family 28-related protein [Klugiella xanthotipulae]TQM65672.1 pectate lyase-like protein [Klugiella xanthotipulae]